MRRTKGLTLRAIYPGSFDPVTNGHLDIIERASQMFDELIVAVLHNPNKQGGLFSVDERVDLLRQVTGAFPNVTVDSFGGLTADYARIKEAKVTIRGLRAVSDFDAELRIALTNRKLNPDLETVFLMTRAGYLFLSSSVIKEIASFGGSVRGMVPDVVADSLDAKFSHLERAGT